MPTLRAGDRGERGSAPAEFALVAGILTLLILGVMQLAIVMHVRNVVHDAAVAGAYEAALHDSSFAAGAELTRRVIRASVGERYAGSVDVYDVAAPAGIQVEVRVITATPVFALIGVPHSLDISARAPRERVPDE